MLFYKVASPIGNIIIKSVCKQRKIDGFGGCYCYKKFEHCKRLSFSQLNEYQECKYNKKRQQNIKSNS